VRDGTVLVTNAPGSGLLSQPALFPHWPELSRVLLGSELALPPSSPGALDPASPLDAEEFWEDRSWKARPFSLRLFAALGPEGWILMPGGLAQSLDVPASPLPFGGTKKDLWFLSADAEPPVSLLPSGEGPAGISRGQELPSRVADDLFWLGRYSERAWVDIRYLAQWWEVRSAQGSGLRDPRADFMDALVRALGVFPELSDDSEPLGSGAIPGFAPSGASADWSRTRLAETVAAMQRVASQVLDRMSVETHRILREIGSFTTLDSGTSVPSALSELSLHLAAFTGLSMESMTRNPLWRFLDMGRRLERAHLVIDGVLGVLSSEGGEDKFSLLLDIFDSTLTYRTRYRLAPQRGPVLDLLLLDETNPRSLAFQLESLNNHVAQLPRSSQRHFASLEERVILDLLTRVRLSDGWVLPPGKLDAFLEGITQGLEAFGDALHRTYLAKIDSMESLQSRGRGVAP